MLRDLWRRGILIHFILLSLLHWWSFSLQLKNFCPFVKRRVVKSYEICIDSNLVSERYLFSRFSIAAHWFAGGIPGKSLARRFHEFASVRDGSTGFNFDGCTYVSLEALFLFSNSRCKRESVKLDLMIFHTNEARFFLVCHRLVDWFITIRSSLSTSWTFSADRTAFEEWVAKLRPRPKLIS